jgi:hypothetical protein
VITTAWEAGKLGVGSFRPSWENLFSKEPVFGVFALSGLLHFGRAYITEPNMVQRYLIARTDREAQRGVLAGLFSCVPIWILFAFIGSCLWAYYQTPFIATPVEPRAGDRKRYMVTGNINEAIDILAEDVVLPPLEEGDLIALMNAGGYGSACASNHCMRGRFGEYLVD